MLILDKENNIKHKNYSPQEMYLSLGRKRKNLVKNMYYFLYLLKIKSPSTNKTFQLSSNSNVYNKDFVQNKIIAQNTLSKYISILVKLNILTVVNSNYKFISESTYCKIDTFAKEYKIDKVTLNNFIKYIEKINESEKLNIPICSYKNYTKKDSPYRKEIIEKIYSLNKEEQNNYYKSLYHGVDKYTRYFTDHELSVNSKKNVALYCNKRQYSNNSKHNNQNRTYKQYCYEQAKYMERVYNMKNIYQDIDFLNKRATHEDDLIQYKINIETNKAKNRIIKVGGRAYNSVCSMVTHKKHPEYEGVSREDYLTNRLGKDWVEYDITASIFAVTYMYNHNNDTKYLFDKELDLYKEINGGKWNYTNERNDFKIIGLRNYFSESKEDFLRGIYNRFFYYVKWMSSKYCLETKDLTEKKFYNYDDFYKSIKNIIHYYYKDSEVIISQLDSEEKKYGDNISYFYDWIIDTAQEIIKKCINIHFSKIWDNTRKIIGKTQNSSIFLIESNLYIQLKKHIQEEYKRLYNEDIEIIQVYDAFYVKNKDIKKNIENNIIKTFKTITYIDYYIYNNINKKIYKRINNKLNNNIYKIYIPLVARFGGKPKVPLRIREEDPQPSTF